MLRTCLCSKLKNISVSLTNSQATLVLTVLFFAPPGSVSLAEQDPALAENDEGGEIVFIEDALDVPAIDLIQSYMFTQWVVNGLIPLAEMGATVYAGSERITEQNAQKKLEKFRARLDIYSEAIRRRGYAQVAGRYRGASTEECDRSGAFWLGSIGSDEIKAISIAQDDLELTMTLSVLHEDSEFDLDISGFIVESSLVLMDPMNSDYYVLGRVFGEHIKLWPDPNVPDAWPEWAAPPKSNDVENCLVELTPF